MRQTIRAKVLRVLEEHCIKMPAPYNATLPENRINDASHGVDERKNEEEQETDGSHVSIVNRCHQGDSASVRPTILVESDWEEPSSSLESTSSAITWPAAILQIQSALKAAEEPIATLDIDIEFIASPGTRGIKVEPRLHAEFTKRYWAELSAGISQILHNSGVRKFLESSGHHCVQTITHLNPWPIEISIAVDERSKETDWPPVVDAIKAYLRQKDIDFDIDVYVFRCEVWSLGGFD